MTGPSRRAGRGKILSSVAAACIFLASATGAKSTEAAPYRPAKDTEVLERLPTPSDAAQRDLRRLRRALAKTPRNLDLALELARRYVALGRAEADPRYYGYAEAALMPWWDLETPPVEVLVLRAVVRQNRHAFDLALDDLARVLELRPNHAQALLTQAFVLQVKGRYGEAERSCRGLPQAVDRLIVATCLGRIASLTGQATTGYELLRSAIMAAPQADPRLRLWALTNVAEIAVRLGKTDEAERHFREAFDLEQRNAYLLGAFADFLLDQGRAEEARRLLQNETRIDALLLRLAIAEDRLGRAAARTRREDLDARFEASRRRGSRLHQREEARFNLDILKRPGEALRLAEANWAVQKEPQDAVLVLRAAFAAGEPDRAQPVAAWLRGVGFKDVETNALLRRAERG